MSRQFAALLLVVLVTASAVSANQTEAQQQPPPTPTRDQKQAHSPDQNRWKWWINPDHRREIGITDTQSRQINEIFEAMMPGQRLKAREFRELEQAVAKLLKERVADVATVTQQVEKLEKLEAELDATRTVMLYRMNLVLTPEQSLRLDEFRKRRDENRRKSDHR
jgi:Spy/CpxP family protein refolding chaperone